ncbi:hypothetical protein M9H77_14640 [Catharanthus roseus]|uniref:Uncharacterized protein n=1 Tax=Catharanthus roseus TaxID=4058 RepID=A0ACC0BNX1_CATRO|nr:hypothetical protein M9H77_14640 [Catharanthus roseus]
MDHGHLFATDRIFNSKPELVNWAKETTIKVNTYLIVSRHLSSRTSDRRPYVTLGCECRGANKPRKKPVVDYGEKEVPVKRRGPYGTKKCGCPFKLKGEQMTIYENWQVFVHDERHNHAIGVHTHGYAQAAKLTEEQLIQIEQFRKSHVAQKIYNVVAKIKKNRMQGQNTDYTVFYRNREDNNMLSDIVVANPTSIEMLRTWSYVLIMDKIYKTNKYNMLLLEVVGMTPTGKNFTVASAFMRNEQATTYRWVLQQIKHLYFSNTISTENQEDVCETMPKVIITDKECGLMPVISEVFNTAYAM